MGRTHPVIGIAPNDLSALYGYRAIPGAQAPRHPGTQAPRRPGAPAPRRRASVLRTSGGRCRGQGRAPRLAGRRARCDRAVRSPQAAPAGCAAGDPLTSVVVSPAGWRWTEAAEVGVAERSRPLREVVEAASVIRRICVFTCSTQAFDSLLVSAASTLARCSVIVFARLTNGSSRIAMPLRQLSSSLMASPASSSSGAAAP